MINVTQTMIIDNQGKILICKRSQDKTFYPDRWSLVGGIIRNNKLSYEEYSRNIIYKKTGLKLSYLTFVDLKKDNFNNSIKCFSFVCRIPDPFPKIILSEDFSEFRFVKIKEIEKYNIICHNNNELSEFYSNIVRDSPS